MKRKLTALLLVLALLCTFVTPVMAGDNWWEEYVTNPMDDITITGVREDGTVETEGDYILFTSDVHRYAYLAKDLLKAANDAITDGGKVGLFAFGGDFANEYVLYQSNMSIIKAAVGDTPATYTKGNHEGSTSDEEFKELTGMSRIGETAINKDGDYYFYNFGAYDKNQAFQAGEIEELSAWLEEKNDGKPIFIVSHYPLHYYNDRRSSKMAADVLELLNDYPQVTFLWGHNHTEQDPNYGMIRIPGDIIQTGATADTSVEIRFTYACLGACRDGWNGANGLLAQVNGKDVTFSYIALNNAMSTESWTDAQGNVNTIRVPQEPGVSSTTEVKTDADFNTITLANVQIDRPLAAQEPSTMASEYSDRFSASEVTWDAGATFDFGTAYTATFTLTAEEGYTFASDAVVSVNKEYVGPMPGQENHKAAVAVSGDGKTAEVSYTFDATVGKAAEPYTVATSLEYGQNYVIASSENYAASYIYDPAQHGEESMPDYTVAPADVVVQDGKLLSETDPSTVFTAQLDVDGYLLWSDASLKEGLGATTLNYLTMSTRGGDLGLEAAETAGNTIYNNWDVTENGVLYLNVDGAVKYLTFEGGKFCYTDDAAESNVRLYNVGMADGTIYNAPVYVTAPVAGETASAEAHSSAGTGTAVWDAETFDYNTAYTVTVTLTPYGIVNESALTARVNGNAADVEVVDGKIVVTYTFEATGAEPGAETVAINSQEEAVAEGYYVIAVGNKAMTITPNGIYQGSAGIAVADGKIISPVTTDMIFQLVGNAEDGYALKNGSQYLAGRSVNNSPDIWGFTTTNDVSKAVTFNYVDGKLEVVSTGASAGGPGGPGGPPPGGNSSTSYLYENNGHFNFSAYNNSDITMYKLDIPFTDVTNGWAQKYIVEATMLGLMKGDSATKFLPDEDMTRAMAITVLYRLSGSPEVTGTSTFTDLEAGRFYEKAAIWGEQNGIVNGTDPGIFNPHEKVSREMFASMVARFLNYKGIDVDGEGKNFVDIDAAHAYAKADIETCVKAGIINGDPDGSFRPRDNIIRKEAAKMLVCLNEMLG